MNCNAHCPLVNYAWRQLPDRKQYPCEAAGSPYASWLDGHETKYALAIALAARKALRDLNALLEPGGLTE
jgi:hypothetical protein